MRDPGLDEARARQRRTLRAIHDSFFADWRPRPSNTTLPSKAERPFVEIALRRAADEAAPQLEYFFVPSRDLAHAETATAAIKARVKELSFDGLLAALEATRAQAVFQLEALHFEQQDGARWVHLAVWADELADDGYRDPRLNT